MGDLVQHKTTTADPTPDGEWLPPADGDLEDPLAEAALATTLGGPAVAPGGGDVDAAVEDVNDKLRFRLFKNNRTLAADALDRLLEMDDASLTEALAVLHEQGQLETLLKRIPRSVHQSRPGDVLRLYHHSPHEVLLARAEDLVTFGLFDLAITKGEKAQVLDLLSALPQDQRDAFLYADEGRLYDSLMAADARHQAKDARKARREDRREARRETRGEGDGESLVSDDGGLTVDGLDDLEVDPLQTEDLAVDGDVETGPIEGLPDSGLKPNKAGLFKRVGGAVNTLTGLGRGEVGLEDAEAMLGGTLGGYATLDHSADNVLELDPDWSAGLFEASMADLKLSGVAAAGATTGAVGVKGLEVAAKWKTVEDPDTYLDLSANRIEVNGLVYPTDETTYSVDRLVLNDLELHGEDAPITQSKPMKRGEALKLVGNQILTALKVNLPAVKGLLMQDGAYEAPETLGSRLADQFGGDLDLHATLADLTLQGVKADGQDMVGELKAEGLSVDLVDTKVTDRLRSDQAELAEQLAAIPVEDGPAREALQAQIEALDVEIATLEGQEERLGQLQAKWDAAELSRAEQDELIELRNTLRVAGLSLHVDRFTSKETDAFGYKYDAVEANTLDVDVTGGALEDMRRHRSTRETLDDAIASRRADLVTKDPALGNTLPSAERIENKATPEMRVDGTLGDVDLDGFEMEMDNPYDTRLSADAQDLAFGMRGDDLDLTAKTFAVDDVAYDPYGTTLDRATGSSLDLSADLSTYAFDMTAADVSMSTLDVGEYATTVDEGTAKTVSFGMAANGDMDFGATGVDAQGIGYDEGGDMDTRIGRARVDAVGGSMTGTGADAVTQVAGSGLTLDRVDYDPDNLDVGVDQATAGSFGLRMDTEVVAPAEGDGDPTYASPMKVWAADVGATGITYGPDGGASSATVASASTDRLDVGMPVDGSVELTSDAVETRGITYGVTSGSTGTTVDAATLGGLQTGLTADGDIYAKAGTVGVDGIEHRDSGTTVGRFDGTGFDYSTDDEGMGVTLATADAQDIAHASTGTTLGRARMQGVDVGIPNQGDLTVSASSGTLSDLSTYGTDVARTDLEGLDLSYGDEGLNGSVSGVVASDITHASSATTVTSATGQGVGFRYGNDGAAGVTADMLDVTGIDVASQGVSVDGTVLYGLDAGLDDEGVYARSEMIDAQGIRYDAGGHVVDVGSAMVTDLDASGIDPTAKGFKGTVDAGSVQGQDITYTGGRRTVEVADANLFDVYADGDGEGGLLARVGSGDVHDASYDDGPYGGSLTDVDLEDLRVEMSGLTSGGTPGLDALSLEEGSVSGVKGAVGLGEALDDAFAEVLPDFDMDQFLADHPIAPPTVAQDNTRVAPTYDPDLMEPQLDDKGEVVGFLLTRDPGKPFQADPLATASGTVKVDVPISIDLGRAGTLQADASLSVRAQDGRVELDDIDLDLDWVADVADAAGMVANFKLQQNTTCAIEDYGLNVAPGGSLQLWIRFSYLYAFEDTVFIDLFDGSDYGLTDVTLPEALQGQSDYIHLQTLVEHLMSVDPSWTVEPIRREDAGALFVEETTADTEDDSGGPSMLDNARDGVAMIDPYVDVDNVAVSITGLQLGDGALGNDDWGATLSGADEGMNTLDADLVAGGTSTVRSDGLQADDIYYKGDKDVGVDRARVSGVDLTGRDLVGSVDSRRAGQVTGSIDRVDVEGTTYGDDLREDDRFAKAVGKEKARRDTP